MNKMKIITLVLLFIISHLSHFCHVSAQDDSSGCTFAQYRLDSKTTLKISSTNSYITVVMECTERVWLGVGVNESGSMVGGKAIIGSSTIPVKKYNLMLYGARIQNAQSQTLINTAFTQSASQGSRLTFTKLLKDVDQEVKSEGNVRFIWARGASNTLGYHASMGDKVINLKPCSLTETASPTMSLTGIPTASPTMSPTQFPTKIPTISPTVMPSLSPTASPTIAPIESPTLRPSSSPTMSPTIAPTFGPTVSPSLKPIETESTESPTMTLTISPTSNSTAIVSPSTAPSASTYPSCVDSPLLFIAQGKLRNCTWVSENPVDRCDDMWALGARAELNIKSHCPWTCGGCEEYECSDTVGNFILTVGKKECCWLDSLSTVMKKSMCSERQIQTTCPERCNVCSDGHLMLDEKEID